MTRPPSKINALLAAFALLGTAPAALPGCAASPARGYAFDTAYPEDVRTVSVQIFDNQTNFTGLEFRLADALAKEIQKTTPYRITASERSDTNISGVLTRASLRTLSRSVYVQELAYELDADFEWRDNRSGDIRVGKQNLGVIESFVPVRPTQDRLAVGERAAVQAMARQIVSSLRDDW